MGPSILAIDNDQMVLLSFKMLFRDEGIDVVTATSGEQGISIFRDNPSRFPTVLLDYQMTKDGEGMNGDEVARLLKAIHSAVHIIIVSGSEAPEVLRACTDAGAEEFLVKGSDTNQLVGKVKSILLSNDATFTEEDDATRAQKISRILKMVGRSPELSHVADLISKFAVFDEPVLILGESGAGKELVAAAVHENSTRKGKPFLAINCAAVGRDVLESELFGHERGAFTGAITKKLGLFERANGGTIFLDEIGDMPLELQAKILRALQEKTIQPVGGVPKKVDFRIVAATHRNLKRAAEREEFRQDLYYRLKYLTVDVPPLRERPEDIEPLVIHFISQMEAKSKLTRPITVGAMRQLKSHNWPGNVRDLEAVVKKAFALSDTKITPEVLRGELEDCSLSRLQSLRSRGDVVTHQEFQRMSEDVERWLLMRAMELTGNVKSAAAKLLGMNHNTMNNRRVALGIESALTLRKGAMK